VNSLFYDPNIYGRFLMVAMLALTAAVLWSSRRRAVPMGAAVLAVLWAGMLTTRSESSLLGLVVGLAILLVLRAERRQLGRAAGLALAAAAIAAIAIAAITGNSSLRKATSGRNDLLSGGVRLFTARPVLGWGSGSFAHQYELHHDAPSARAVAASHTIPVTVAAEQGVVGLAVYLALLAACFRVVLRAARTSAARAAVAAAFGALVVHTLLYAAFLEDPLTWILLAAGLALPLGTVSERARVAAQRSSSDAAAFSPSSR
jgi:O-antigen ligase